MTRTMTNAEVAATFRLLADLLAIRGESVFKVNAYRRAAESIAALAEPMAAIRQRGDLGKIPGVGKEIAQKIGDLLDTGSFKLLDSVRAEFPPGVATLLAVPGIGPKRARALYQSLGIDSIDALRAAVADSQLGAAGVGSGEAARIATSLSTLQVDDDRLPLGVARTLGLDLIGMLRQRVPNLKEIELAGSIRRMRETIGDLDIVAAAEDPHAVVTAFLTLPAVARIEARGENRCRVVLQQGVAADLWVLPEEHWGALLLHVTGSKFHDIRMRDLALDRGARLSEYGITVGEKLTPFVTEDAVYAWFGMQFIPPTMREDTGEIDLALRGALPSVVQATNLRGDLHMHTNWSDGTRTVRAMALAARARGYAYCCITDHSQGLGIANGLTVERLEAQREEIAQVNAELAPFRVLQGVEVEVRTDGSLDLPDDALAALNLVIAAIHTGLSQDQKTLTHRAVRAIRHPLVDILAHPTGRLLTKRSGGAFDMEVLYAEAAESGTVLEIDGDPARLDLRDIHARAAIAAGCTLSIDSDAHTADGLENVTYGVAVAQRAWVPAARVLNTLPVEALLAQRKRNRRAT